MPPVTPFFADFHRRLFGKAPLSALQERLRHSPQIPSISHYQELFGKLVAPELFLPVQRGTNSRQRIFSPALTFWSFLGQVARKADTESLTDHLLPLRLHSTSRT